MKIIMIQGGLGNQLYEYIYYQYLKLKFPKCKIQGFYYKKWLSDHNGLEINRWFNVELPPANKIVYSVSVLLYYLASLCKKIKVSPFFINKNWEQDDNAFFQIGFWQDSKYIKYTGLPSFKEIKLNDYNKSILSKIKNCNSVSVHVRRGDYLSPSNNRIYGNICNTEYYKKSISFINDKEESPHFFVFSNDLEYVKELFKNEEDVTIVDQNQGDMSFFDMYLMAHCKNMILANSSFSAWAAYLNQNTKIVCAPHKWVNVSPAPNVYMDNWIKINVGK